MDIDFISFPYRGYKYEIGVLGENYCWRVGSYTSPFSYDMEAMHAHARDYIDKAYFGGEK